MSDIKAGDLVVVVKPTRCGCPQRALGRIFRVVDVRPSTSDTWGCSVCGYSYPKLVGEGPFAVDEHGKRRGLYRLKRIPPLEELEGQREEQREPALI